MPRSYYDILGVSRDAEPAAIKKAFRDLARKHHPDVNPDDPKAAERFKEVSHAHEILSDAEKRKLYDEFGDEAERSSFNPAMARAARSGGFPGGGFPGGTGGFAEGADLDDLFAQAFGRRRGPRRGRDHRAQLAVDLRTAVLGGERTLDVGGAPLRVRIPAGIKSGGSLRLRGHGEAGPQGGPSGDLVIKIEVLPDATFTREGNNLHVEIPITLGEALRGAQVEVPTLTTAVRLRVPPASQTGRVLRVKGRGVAPEKRLAGDLLVTLKIVLPDIADHDVDAAINTLEALYGDVRAHLKADSTAA